MPQVLIVNGALGGSTGNTAELLAIAEDFLTPRARVRHLELCREPRLDRIEAECGQADAFLFGTGTYWDSWGSPLQRFLEETAHTEGADLWRGKPVGVIVTAHAVGAKEVVSRLQGVLNAYGMMIPPFSGMSYTWVNDVARQNAPLQLKTELWTPEDAAVVCHNLLEALGSGRDWRCWPTSHGAATSKWLNVYSGKSHVES